MPPPSTSKTAPASHSQPSRKGRKAWRRNIDVSEVDSGLDALRAEIRISGGPVTEQTNEQLFSVDVAGDEAIKTKHKLTKPLKVDQILAQRSAVPGVDSRKRKADIYEIGDGVYYNTVKRRKEDWVAKKDVLRLKQNLDKKTFLGANEADAEIGGFDLWAAPVKEVVVNEKSDEYVPKVRAKVAPATISRAPVPMTANGKPTKAIPQPEGGKSYNPTFEDWDTLITREGEKEIEAEQARIVKAQADAEKQARVALIAAKPDDGYETGGESAWEGFETENEDDMLKKKRPSRKTPQQRKKVVKRQLLERQHRHELASGRKQKQSEEALKALGNANKERHLIEADLEDSDNADGPETTQLRRRRLGPMHIPEEQLELVLPDELQDSLRRLKPEGNLMTDRFRNLLVNGKLEARKRVLPPRKKKVKMTEKWTHKDELQRLERASEVY